MLYDFVRVAAATPEIRVAEPSFNADSIIKIIDEAEKNDVKLLVFPELCITGYTCGDLFIQETLLEAANKVLAKIISHTEGLDVLTVVGLPWVKCGKLYNVAAAIQNGKLLALVPKMNIPNHSEFYEMRHFSAGNENIEYISYNGMQIPFGSRIILRNRELRYLSCAIEICEDLWTQIPPSSYHGRAGAAIIMNPSASDEVTGKKAYRSNLVATQSARIYGGYIFADAGEGESTTDLVFAGHNMIAENGRLLKQSDLFTTGMITTEIDLGRIAAERRRVNTYQTNTENYLTVEYSYPSLQDKLKELTLSTPPARMPFVPADSAERNSRCMEILGIQTAGLRKRMKHINCKNTVIGVSGGLDSTLALLVIRETYLSLGLDMKGIHAITMPCFGTTDRTYNNAIKLATECGATVMEIPISDAVLQHFKDINQDVDKHDITYENAQARERTQVLMDIANKMNGLVVGTGDLSELALGWATYNGDHMSMYGVNASVPKTLVRYLVAYYADNTDNQELREVLLDVLDTPVSPELLPPTDGKISQKTEEIVGPYELHDYFLYYCIRYGYTPEKIYHLAKQSFKGVYDEATIAKWLTSFYKRFFSQQFKRSCVPDGPKVGSVALSPRGDLRMPSDASVNDFIKKCNFDKI